VTDDTPSTRTGYVTLVGRPNAGKSTLMNRFIGEHISIVTPKAQTTWERVTGILTRDATQMVFLDTPGLLEARDLLQKSMLGAALSALGEADVILVVIDARYAPSPSDEERLLSALGDTSAPLHLALNKVDEAEQGPVLAWRAWAGEHLPRGSVHEISASVGTGVDELLAALAADLPESPFLYPDDEIASQPVRFFVEELVRETVFEMFHEEVPYSVVCRVGEFRETQDPVYIQIDVHVERKSQKGILIGKGGSAIRELGARARAKIEHFLGRNVYLDLWVKPLKSWRKNRTTLGTLGFQVPEEEDR
jgi:GTPase